MTYHIATTHIMLASLLILASCGQPVSFVEKQRPGLPSHTTAAKNDSGDSTPNGNNSNNQNGEPNTIINDPSVTNIGPGNPQSNTPPKTTDVCAKQGLKLSAPNLVFLIDNSGSNRSMSGTIGTDCPQQLGQKCTGEPVRKLTVLEVIRDLAEVSASAQDESATSQLSIVSYSNNSQVHVNKIAADDSLDINSLASTLDFTKSPDGTTNYVAAFDKARNIFSTTKSSATEKQKVVVHLTDGFPTVRPQSVFDSAETLRRSGVKIITVVYTKGEDFETVAKQWEKTVSGFTQAEKDWVTGSGRDSLIADISDHAFLIKDVNKLPELVSLLVSQHALDCK